MLHVNRKSLLVMFSNDALCCTVVRGGQRLPVGGWGPLHGEPPPLHPRPQHLPLLQGSHRAVSILSESLIMFSPLN